MEKVGKKERERGEGRRIHGNMRKREEQKGVMQFETVSYKMLEQNGSPTAAFSRAAESTFIETLKCVFSHNSTQGDSV